MKTINLNQKFDLIDGYWQPKIVAQLNGQYVKLAKFKGEFDWHSHEFEDEFFQVIEGQIDILLRDQVITLRQGECFVVPKGVEHKPVATEEAQVLLFEPIATLQTGDKTTPLTVNIDDQNWI